MIPVRRSGTVSSVDREYKRPGPIIVIDYEALRILDARALDGTVYTDFQESTSFPSCLGGHRACVHRTASGDSVSSPGSMNCCVHAS